MTVSEALNEPDIIDLLDVDADFAWGSVPRSIRRRYAVALWVLALHFDGECRAGEAARAWRQAIEAYDDTLLKPKGAASTMIATALAQGWITTEGGGERGKRTTVVTLNIFELPDAPDVIKRNHPDVVTRFYPHELPKPPKILDGDAKRDVLDELRSAGKGDGESAPKPESAPDSAETPPAAPAELPAAARNGDAHDGHTISLGDNGTATLSERFDEVAALFDEPAFETPAETPTALQSIGARLGTAASLIYETLFELAEIRPMQAVDDAVAERLAVTLEENQRLRKKLNEATETARAHKSALDAAQRMNRQLQENLNKALGRPLDDRAWRELERLVRSAPGPDKQR